MAKRTKVDCGSVVATDRNGRRLETLPITVEFDPRGGRSTKETLAARSRAYAVLLARHPDCYILTNWTVQP